MQYICRYGQARRTESGLLSALWVHPGTRYREPQSRDIESSPAITVQEITLSTCIPFGEGRARNGKCGAGWWKYTSTSLICIVVWTGRIHMSRILLFETSLQSIACLSLVAGPPFLIYQQYIHLLLPRKLLFLSRPAMNNTVRLLTLHSTSELRHLIELQPQLLPSNLKGLNGLTDREKPGPIRLTRVPPRVHRS